MNVAGMYWLCTREEGRASLLPLRSLACCSLCVHHCASHLLAHIRVLTLSQLLPQLLLLVSSAAALNTAAAL